jgi:putative MFS transporter
MAESVPARRRGWLVVLHGGMGTVGGTLVAAGCAALLEPYLSWRALWLLNLPTGVLMLVLNRWIPESPRYLLERGRTDEARAVMARYGVVLEEGTGADGGEDIGSAGSHYGEMKTLFRHPLLIQTGVVVAYGLAWGLVNWGFIAFLPTFLQGAGIGASRASFLVFLSALVAIPGTVLVAFAYGMWSSRKSMIAYAAATVACLLGLAALDQDYGGNQAALVGLLGLLFAASGGVIAMLSPYTAEVYPTRLRGTGSGLSAASSKLGGLMGGIGSVTGLIGISSGMLGPAVLVSIPMVLAGLIIAARGIETRGRRLEEIAAQQFDAGPVA